MVVWNLLRRVIGRSEQPQERRRYPRYRVAASLFVEVDGRTENCSLDDVSAGGVRLSPRLDAAEGTIITVRDADSGLELTGRIVGSDSDGTRVSFDSEDAGIVVSTWLRIANEAATAAASRPR